MIRILLVVALISGCVNRAKAKVDHQQNETDPMSKQCSAPAETLPDRILAPNGQVIVHIGIVEAGRKEIEVRSVMSDSVLLNFTTGAVDVEWLPNSRGLIYSVAPIYDVPGIFARSLRSGRVTTVIPAQIKDAAYPGGADWIRLCGVESSGSEIVIRFARFGHIDEVDFEHPPLPNIETMRLPLPN